MDDINKRSDGAPIIIYYYFDLSDTEAFCLNLEKWFRDSGHTRPLEFRSWNCYNEKPGYDGDIYCYDAIVMSTLVDEGYLRVLPDIIDTGRVFPWILDRSRIHNKIYGIPLMACSNVLICREEDDFPMSNIFDIPQGLAAPLKSMAYFYYLYAFCTIQGQEDSVNRTIKQLKLLMNNDTYENSHFATYDGFTRFMNGDCKYIIGFTEDIRRFDTGRYKVRTLNLSDNPTNEMPLYPVDLASLGRDVSGDKLLDCLDLLEIMTDQEFIFNLCLQEGRLQYMLPPCRSVYGRLAEIDPIYDELYRQLLPEENGVFRYGKSFYEDFYQKSDKLLESLV